jgi:seryl-tRNA synthetase
MLEIKFVSQNLSAVQKALAARGHHADLDVFKKCDDERRTMLQEIESLRHQRNVVSDRIAEMKKAGDDAATLVLEMRVVSSKIKELDKQLSENQ